MDVRSSRFGKIEKSEETVQKNKVNTTGGDQYVVVRVDIVKDFLVNGKKSNVIIPVDAKDDNGLNAAESMVKKLGVKIVSTVEVNTHIPDPPHFAHGYITKGEKKLHDKAGLKEKINAGRQHASPGSNKWG